MQSVTKRDPNRMVLKLLAVLTVVVVAAVLITKRQVDRIPVIATSEKGVGVSLPAPTHGPLVTSSSQIAIATPDRTVAYDDPPGSITRSLERAPESLVALKQRAAKFAFDDFLQATRVAVASPVVIDEFSLGSAGGEQMEFHGTSRFGDEITLVVKTGIDEDALRRWFVTDRGYQEVVLLPEVRGRTPMFRAKLDGRNLLIRTGTVPDSTTTFLYVWVKSTDHTDAEITAF